jgi:hypothetical protein
MYAQNVNVKSQSAAVAKDVMPSHRLAAARSADGGCPSTFSLFPFTFS